MSYKDHPEEFAKWMEWLFAPQIPQGDIPSNQTKKGLLGKPMIVVNHTPGGSASCQGATPKKRHDKRMNDAARRRGMNVGNLGPHLNTEALDWLAKNKPPEMNIAEYMAKAILPDVMAEDAE